ncbi:glycosyltransferase family 4 protein [Dehalobacter sp. TBBPA1]|uniref:glycosyltransferase family 4 protein n=1 Tax=Dehalobacter sp. TBBPA1 TaxID=3235037 RepID=UPI0034A11B68
MKIAMIGQKGISIFAGGVERHVEEISKRLTKKGHEVTVYCRAIGKAGRSTLENYHGINLKYIPTSENKYLEPIIYTFKATMDSLTKQYDIIHYHALGPASLSFIPKIIGKNVIVTVHGLDWKRDKWGQLAKLYLKFGEKVSARFPDKVISVSENLREYYLYKYIKKEDEVIYIPNGVNSQPLREEKEIMKYGLEKGKYILFLARLVPEKGAHYLINAYRDLSTDKKLVIAGGSSYTDSYVNEIKEKNPNNKIIFTGDVKGPLLEELFSNAFVYVLPSDVEGMPITLLEAMSYRKCCLVSDIPENVNVIDEDCGFSFKKSDESDLKRKLEYLLLNPEIVNITGQKAYEKVVMHYNWDNISESTEKVYYDVFNKCL